MAAEDQTNGMGGPTTPPKGRWLDIKQNLKAAMDWSALIVEFVEPRPGGVFFREFRNWYVEFKRPAANPTLDVPLERLMVRNMKISFGMLIALGILTSKDEYPDRLYLTSGIRLTPEPCFSLSSQGRQFATWSPKKRRRFLGLRLIWHDVKPIFGRMRTPLMLASFALTACKFWLQWSTIQSAGSAAAVAVATFAIGILRGRGDQP